MLKQPMIDKLVAMRLNGMAEGLHAQEQDPAMRERSFLERFSMLVDQQWSWRENQALARRTPSCAPTPAPKISTSAPPAGWTKVWFAAWSRNRPGCAILRTFLFSAPPAWAKAS